jgi:uncharacterized SAM-binding protein YcdF (DUF218 family)
MAWAAALTVLAAFVVYACLHAGYWLIATGPLPQQAQVAIVLSGSVKGFMARRAGGMQLLQSGVVSQLAIDVPSTNEWMQPMVPVAQHYFSTQYGPELASRVVICPLDADSTIGEAQRFRKYIQQNHWHTMIVVTSNYHTRRAGIIWRKVYAGAQPPYQIVVTGVDDPEYDPAHYWRRRIFAKVWLLESAKLFWTLVAGPDGPWSGSARKL